MYCAAFAETRLFSQELVAKTRLRLRPGTYRLPDSGTGHQFALPLWLETASGMLAFGAGTLGYTRTDGATLTTHRFAFTQPLTVGSRELRATISLQQPLGAPVAFTLSGEHFDSSTGIYLGLVVCQTGATCGAPDDVYFDACASDSYSIRLHRFEFDNGLVEFELQLGSALAGTSPYAFVRAAGTFAGAAFDQKDYFKLIYQAGHHHYPRHFAVLFDEMIAGVGGIEVENASEAQADSLPAVAYTLDSNLNRLQQLPITSETVSAPGE